MNKPIVRFAAFLLVIALVAGVVGTGYALCVDPGGALRVALGGAVLALLVCRALDEYGWLYAILAGVFAILGNALYVLHLLGVTEHVIVVAALVLVSAIGLVLMVSLIASGAADPYDD